MKNTKILIVDDHPLMRAGVLSILESNSNINIIGEAGDGVEAVAIALEKKPDIIIMDITLPQLSGIDATKEILKENPDIKIIALSIHSGQNFVNGMLDAGAVGYLLKEEVSEELLRGIEKVMMGNMFLSSAITRTALSKETKSEEATKINILASKLHRPLVLSNYLLRPKIIHQLENNIVKPLSIISAGAGYGKSVVASQWLEQTDSLNSWITLDEEHNDLRIFLNYLVAAIDKVMPGMLEKTKELLTIAILPPLKDISNTLINDLCDIDENLILLLDDYHMIKESKVHDLINDWLNFPPPSIHLCILTRRDPPLNTRYLKLAGRITEIRMNDLSFTKSEISEFYSQIRHVELPAKSIELLHNKTEGWVLGLRLFSMIMTDEKEIDQILSSAGSGLHSLSEYLLSEVLNKQPQHIQDLLIETSILNRFCSELVNEVSNSIAEDSSDKERDSNLIQWLTKYNLFTISLDIEQKWFRYHHLFQDFLYGILKEQRTAQQINNLHLKASHWFEDHRFLEEAMDHAIIIKNYDRVSEMIKLNRLDLLNSNNFYQLERLLRKIPKSIIESDPELILIELHLQWFHGNFIRLGELEEKMNLLIDGLKKDSYVRHEFYFFVGFNSLFLKGDLTSALSNLDLAMEFVPESSSEPRGVLETHYMIFSQLGGAYGKVCQMFYELIGKEMAPIRKNRIFQGFLIASLNQADMNEFESNYINALSFARESNMKDSLGVILFLSASLMTRKGNWNNAIRYCNEVVDIKYFAHTRSVVDSMTQLIIIHSILNEKGRAEEMINILENYIERLGDFFKPFLWSAKMRYYMINRDHEALKAVLKDYAPGVLDLVMYLDIPEITHARALIFEGSTESLDMAEEELAQLEGMTSALHNRLHLTEVKLLQAMLLNKKGHSNKAKEALLSSFKISEPEGMIFFYLEIGEELHELLLQLKEDKESAKFIDAIFEAAKSIKNIAEKASEQKDSKKRQAQKGNLSALTRRELEVLQCISEGLRNQEIADKLFNSEETIKKHIYHMFQKLHVKNRLSLVSKAKEEGLLE